MIRLLSFVLILGHFNLFAQIAFKGTLVDANQNPIPGAHVSLNELTVVSDLNGAFQFATISPGEYSLSIQALGYKNYSESLRLSKDLDVRIQLTEQLYELDVVKLSASWIKPGQPFTYSQMNKEEIKKQNLGRDMPYLLQNLPSTVVTSDGGTGIGYTGIRIRGSDPTRINVTLDGVPVNDAESQGVFWVDLPDLASNAGAIQVQRGVGTSTNGAGAFGATVNIKTTGLEDQAYGTVELSGGSFNTLRANGRFGTGLIDSRFSFQGSLSHIQSDGYIDRASSNLNSVYLTGTMLGEGSSLKINFLRGKEVTYQAWNGVPAQYITNPNLRTFNTAGLKEDGSFHDNEVDDYGQTHIHAIYHKQWDNTHLQTTLHYTKGAGFYEQFRSSDLLSNYQLEYPIEFDDLIRRRWLDNDFYGAIFNLQQTGRAYTLNIGGGANEYRGNHFGEVVWLGSEGNIDPQEYYRNDATKQDVNLYTQWQYVTHNDWSIFTDLQWRSVFYSFEGFGSDLSVANQKVNHHFFNPKFGAEKKIDQMTAYYSLGVAHREPNRDDYVQSTPFSRPVAERLIDQELGARFSSSNLTMSLNFFWMDYKDQLVLTGAINDVGEYNRVNVPESYRRGAEYSINWKWNPRISLEGNFAWNRSRIKFLAESIDNWDTGEQVIREHQKVPIAFSPEIISSAAIDLTLLKRSDFDFKIRADHRFVGKQYLDNTGDNRSALDGYQQTDLSAHLDWFPRNFERVTFKCQIINLFDRSVISNGWVYRYISAGYDATSDDPHATRIANDTYTLSGYYPQAGIHVLAGISVSF